MTGYSDVLQMCGCAVLAAVCLLVLRGMDRSGITGAAAVCIGAVFALTAICAAKPVLQTMRTLGDAYLGTAWADILWRTMAIAVTVQLTADTVRDVGESMLADRVEAVGRIVLLCIGLPLYKEIFTLAGQLLGM